MKPKKVYTSKRDVTMTVIYWSSILLTFICFFLPIILIDEKSWLNIFVVSAIGSATLILMLDLWFRTYYWFENDHLHLRIGVFKYQIALKTIRSAHHNVPLQHVSSLIKTSWTLRALVLKYNKFDELALSPAEHEAFIDELLSLKPDVEVFEHN